MRDRKAATKRTNLSSKEYRARLPKRTAYHWQKLDVAVYIGYRSSNDTWHSRIRRDGITTKRFLANADTERDADGETVLTYRQATKKVLDLAEQPTPEPRTTKLNYTVIDAADAYIRWAKLRTKSSAATEATIKFHILPKLGRFSVDVLTSEQLERWMDGIAESKARARSAIVTDPKTGKRVKLVRYLPEHEGVDKSELVRRRKATANRVWNMLRALLNHAYRRGHANSDAAWRGVKAFEDVSKPVERFLSQAECRRLLDNIGDDFRPLVTALLLTGARYSEIRNTKVQDFDSVHDTLTVRHPKRRGHGVRSIELSTEAVAFFREHTHGRTGDEYILVREDGVSQWGRSHQTRRMRLACEAAKIHPPVGVHVLRHSVASHLLKRGVGLKYIFEALGHSNIAITSKHYAHVETTELKKQLDRHGMKLAPPPTKEQAT